MSDVGWVARVCAENPLLNEDLEALASDSKPSEFVAVGRERKGQGWGGRTGEKTQKALGSTSYLGLAAPSFFANVLILPWTFATTNAFSIGSGRSINPPIPLPLAI